MSDFKKWWTKHGRRALKNTALAVAAPFTAGLSTLAMEDDAGNSVMGTLTGENSAREQNRKQQKLQQQTNDTSIALANSAHQREIADLQQAGLNPVLSAGGQGAATPTLGTAQVQNTLPGGALAQIETATSAASNIMNAVADVGLKASEAGKNKAETKNIETQTRWAPRLNQAKIDLDNATSALQRQQILESQGRTMALDFQNQMSQMNVQKRSTQWNKELEIYEQIMQQSLIDANFDNTTIGLILKAMGKTVNAASPFIEMSKGGNTYNFSQSVPTVNY